MEQLKIYIDRLKNEESYAINATLPPSILDVNEEDLRFPEEVNVQGEAYLADDHLIVQLSASTYAFMPCSICNEPTKVLIQMKGEHVAIPLAEVRSAIYDLTDEVREMILLQIPQFVECHDGNCPDREGLKKYLAKSQKEDPTDPAQPVHFPFADL